MDRRGERPVCVGKEHAMFKTMTRHFHRWRLRHEARRALALMDDHLLADLGTTRDCISDFVLGQPDKDRF